MSEGNQGVGLQLRSLVTEGGDLELSLAKVPIPIPDDDEILVRIEATPINPSDLGLLLGPADLTTATVAGAGEDAVVTAKIPPAIMRAVAGRVDRISRAGAAHLEIAVMERNCAYARGYLCERQASGCELRHGSAGTGRGAARRTQAHAGGRFRKWPAIDRK